MKQIVLRKRQENSVLLEIIGFSARLISWLSSANDVKVENKLITINLNNLNEFLNLASGLGFELDQLLKESTIQTKSKNEVVSSFVPRDYQITDSQKMYEMKKVILAHEPGVGKTACAILAAELTDSKFIVIVPASLIYNWQSEIYKITGISKRSAIWRVEPILHQTKYVITTYGLMIRHYDDFKQLNYGGVIFDEAHALKNVTNLGNPGTKQAEIGIQLAHGAEYVFCLTGTPMPNCPKEIYNLLIAIDAKKITFNGYFWEFAERYCDPQKINVGKDKRVWDLTGSANADELSSKLSKVMLRRTKAEVLPDLHKQRQIINVHIKDTSEMRIKSDEFFARIMKVRQAISIAKVKFTIDLAESIIESGQKVVICCDFLEPIRIIKQKFKDKAVTLIGEMKKEDRQKAIFDFQTGDAQVFIMSLLAGGIGITLTAANTIIFNDWDFVPANMEQAFDRIARISQKQKYCTAYYISAENNTVDSMIMRIIDRKLKNIKAVVDGNGGDIKNELYAAIKKNEIKRN